MKKNNNVLLGAVAATAAAPAVITTIIITRTTIIITTTRTSHIVQVLCFDSKGIFVVVELDFLKKFISLYRMDVVRRILPK